MYSLTLTNDTDTSKPGALDLADFESQARKASSRKAFLPYLHARINASVTLLLYSLLRFTIRLQPQDSVLCALHSKTGTQFSSVQTHSVNFTVPST